MLILGRAKSGRRGPDQKVAVAIVRDGRPSRHRLDAASVGPDAALRQDLESTDFAGPGDVRAAAELAAEVVDLHHAHEVAVLLPEERDGAEVAGVLEAGGEGAHGMVLHDAPVDQFLDLLELLAPDGLVIGEVEAELVGPHRRAGLGHVLAQPRAQGVVQ